MLINLPLNNKPHKNPQTLFILSKEIIIFIFCSLLTLGIPISYQVFLSHGLEQYLEMHFIVMLPIGAIGFVVKSVGHSFLVILPKDKKLLPSSFSFSLLLILFLLAITWLTQKYFLAIYEVDYPLAFTYYQLNLVALLFASVASLLNYYFIFYKKLTLVLTINALNFLGILLGNSAVWWGIAAEETKIIGYGVVPILVNLLVLISFFYYFFYHLRPLASLKLAHPSPYGKKGL